MSKLSAALLLVLLSDQPGEVKAAIAAINRHLAKCGRDAHWLAEQLATIIETGAHIAPLPPKHTNGHVRKNNRDAGNWQEELNLCMKMLLVLTGREADFIESLFNQWTVATSGWVPSAKQLRWLRAIHERLQAGDPFGRW